MRTTLAILVLWAAVTGPATLSRGYWNPDEGRYGAVAREMWRGDGLLVPRLAGEVYREKPPLFFWTAAGAQALLGSTAAPVSRLPSALATLLAALLLRSLVRRTHGEREGGLAAAVFLTAILPAQMAGWVGLDALATLFVVGAVWAQERARAGGGAWRILIYFALAGAVLTKGAPLAMAVAALAGLAILERGWRGLFPRHLLWGVPLLVGLCAAWALPAAASLDGGAAWLRDLTLGQAERRLVDATSKPQPFWYYLVQFPALFFPWTLLLPAAAVAAVRALRGGGRERVETGRYAMWFALSFVLFSLISGKRGRYLLPLFPAAAALTAIAVVRLADGRRAGALLRVPFRITLASLAVAGLALAGVPLVYADWIAPRLPELPGDQAAEVAVHVRAAWPVLLAAGVSATLVAVDGIFRKGGGAVALAVSSGFLYLAAGGGVLPAIDRVKSAEPLIRSAAARAGPDARWGVTADGPGRFCLALDTDRLLVIEGDHSRARTAEHLRADGDLVMIVREQDLEGIERHLGEPLERLATRRVGSRTLVCVRRAR